MTAAWKPALAADTRPVPVPFRDGGNAACLFHELRETRGDPFSGQITVATLGPIRICHVKARPHATEQLRPIESCTRSPFLKIVFQRKGAIHLEQGERRTIVGCGHWSIYDASRPYAIHHPEAVDQLSILIPRDIKSPEMEHGLRLVPEAAMHFGGTSSVLFNAARSAFAEADCVERTVRESLGEGILELAKLAVFERLGGADRIPMLDTFRERVKRYVLHNLSDSELSVDSIAQALDCSKRYLHKGFAESGATLSQFIWEARLERARRDLACRALANRSITEIAFNWGFVNSAHFSRRFHHRFGMSPRDYRIQAQA